MPATKTVPPYSRGQVSALGVFAEIDTVLARHRQKTSLAISLPLQEKIGEILPTIGIKNIPEEKLRQITSTVAQETISQTLEDIAKVQTPEQISLALADNLTGAITNHPDLTGKIKADDTRVFTKVVLPTQEVYDQNQDALEKAAVLANLDGIAKLQERSEEIKSLIADSVEQTVESEVPLTAPEQRETAKADLSNYLAAYKEELAKQLKITEDNIPKLKELQVVKENAHTEATKKMTRATTPIGPKPATEIPPQNLTGNLAQVLDLKPRRPTLTPQKLPPVGNLILSSPKRINEAYISLLSFDQERLARALKETSEEIEKYKSQKSLTYKERKAYQDALKKQARYVAAQAFHIKQPKKAGAYRTLFARVYGNRPEVASQQAWLAENYFLPSMPRIIAHNERLAAGAAFGSLGFSIAGFSPGSLFSKIRTQALANIGVGMGIAPATPVKSLARKITGIAGGLFGATALYFLGLGQAAATGFLVGAGIGATAGSIAGAVIPVAMLGPAGVLLWPVTVPLGIATGGLIFGVAGGLIGLGIAAGSTTAISMGVGAGIGGVIGGYAGFLLGSAISSAFIGFAAAACAATGIGCILVPIAAISAPIITTTFTAIGALIGSAIGAGIGYVIGNYVIPFFKGAFETITGGAGAGLTAGGGLLASIGSFFTGLASTVWGGITSAGGFILGGLSAAGNFIVGGLSSISIPASAAAIPVFGTIGAVGVGSLIVGTITATTFFSLAVDEPTTIITPGENQYFSVVKTADPDRMPNSDLPRDIKYSIVLTAKGLRLTNIQISDEIKVQSKNPPFNITTDTSGQPVSPPCAATIPTELTASQSWTCEFSIRAESNFADSVVANSITVKATPEGQPEVTDGTVATTVIGNPPTICAIFDIRGPWSQEERNSINEVCATLDRSSLIVSLLQKAGTITLVHAAQRDDQVCGTVNGANTITIYCDMSALSLAKYVIIHELGHVLGNFNRTVYDEFRPIYEQEGLMPTYQQSIDSPDESFAEMITEYVSSKIYNHPARIWSGYPGGPWINPGSGWTTFQNDRPAHYNFAKTKIYGGIEY